MSVINLDPNKDLGLTDTTPTPPAPTASYQPRELSMDKNPDLSGITHLKSTLQTTLTTQNKNVDTPEQVVMPAGDEVIETLAPHVPVATDKRASLFLILAFILFLISLGAAGYYTYMYFFT